MLKILNLYAGIGGNRKLWENVQVTAIEKEKRISEVYKYFYPKDIVIIEDAHSYLLKHFREYDFIWGSPPCPTHSSMAKLCGNSDDFRSGNHLKEPQYPDMSLYEEIIFLKHYFKGKFCIENVIPYYELLIPGIKLQRHIFWTNFHIPQREFSDSNIKYGKVQEWEEKLGYDLSQFSGLDKRKVLRNCVNPYLGEHILNSALQANEDLFTNAQEIDS